MGSSRPNSVGIDLGNEHHLASLYSVLPATSNNKCKYAPMLDCPSTQEAAQPVRNTFDLCDVVGHVQEVTVEDVDNAVQSSINPVPIW